MNFYSLFKYCTSDARKCAALWTNILPQGLIMSLKARAETYSLTRAPRISEVLYCSILLYYILCPPPPPRQCPFPLPVSSPPLSLPPGFRSHNVGHIHLSNLPVKPLVTAKERRTADRQRVCTVQCNAEETPAAASAGSCCAATVCRYVQR